MQARILSLFLIVLLGGWTHGAVNPAPTPPPTATINVAGLTNGTQSVNSLSPTCFTNPADTVAANTTWTTASTKYLVAPTTKQFVIKGLSSCNWRDVEETVWMAQGYVYLRLDGSGNAIYFFHDVTTTNGTLTIGMVTGLDESSYPGGTYYPFYSNPDLVHTVSGYTTTNTDGQFFTFGVSGFTYYVKFGKTSTSATQILSFQDYRQMSSAVVAMKSSGGGFRGDSSLTPSTALVFNPLNLQSLFSNYASNYLDMRDFELRNITTTGSISASSNCLTVASTAGFLVGDNVIVEIGTESGSGARGTVGVGGTWPQKSYANATTLQADNTQAANTYAWETDNGNVWQYVSATWVQLTQANIGLLPGFTSYYTTLAIPLSLQARISAIGSCNGGNSLTLISAVSGNTTSCLTSAWDCATAAATATNANVYLDNITAFNYLVQQPQGPGGSYSAITPNNVTLSIPSGSYVIGGVIAPETHTGWTITGQGVALTTLASAKGIRPAGINASQMPSFTVQNLTVTDNLALTKYGMKFPTSLFPLSIPNVLNASGQIQVNGNTAEANPFTQTAIGNAIPSGVLIVQSDNAIVQNVTVNDSFTNAVSCQDNTNCAASNIIVNIHSVPQHYLQWQLEWTNTTGGGCTNCTINAVAISAGAECFGGTGCRYINYTGLNASMSLNGEINGIITNPSITISDNHTGTIPPEGAWNIQNPLINVNTNTGPATGGTITNPTIVVQGPIDSNNDIPQGININGLNSGVSVNGGSYTAPNYSAPAVTSGPVGILGTGANASVNNFRSCGTINASGTTGAFNIDLSGSPGGTITNSTAHTLSPNTSGNASC